MVYEEMAKVRNQTKNKIKMGEEFTKEDILGVEARSNNKPDGVWSALFEEKVVPGCDNSQLYFYFKGWCDWWESKAKIEMF